MTKERLAERLDGRQYRNEITLEDRGLAEQNGLVIAFGASDDLILLDGAVRDDVDIFNGGVVHLDSKGILRNECEEGDCPYFEEKLAKCEKTITALWCPPGGGSWAYETDIPHATFKVYEDNELYCTGIVFELAALAGADSGDNTCIYQQQDHEGDHWQCDNCGADWIYISDGPKENGVVYCHSCGRKVVDFVEWALEEGDDE